MNSPREDGGRVFFLFKAEAGLGELPGLRVWGYALGFWGSRFGVLGCWGLGFRVLGSSGRSQAANGNTRLQGPLILDRASAGFASGFTYHSVMTIIMFKIHLNLTSLAVPGCEWELLITVAAAATADVVAMVLVAGVVVVVVMSKNSF